MLNFFYFLFRKLIFKLDAEKSHDLVLSCLANCSNFKFFQTILNTSIKQKSIKAMGLTFPNAVGLAAGFDKHARCINGFSSLGFGFVEVGTVTPYPQAGNKRPRIFKLKKVNAIINRMGFNSYGINHFVKNIKNSKFQGILGINIGKNANTPIDLAVQDYIYCMENVYLLASYIAINISSPNTNDLCLLQYDKRLNKLLEALNIKRFNLSKKYGQFKPIVIKISPDLNFEQLRTITSLVKNHNIEGIIACNTTISRDGVSSMAYANELGGLSGSPLLQKSNEIIRFLRSELNNKITIIGVGGILSGQDARSKLDAGADLVQLYTGLIYRGPKLINECIEAIN